MTGKSRVRRKNEEVGDIKEKEFQSGNDSRGGGKGGRQMKKIGLEELQNSPKMRRTEPLKKGN